jgi:hypothetical protein
MCRPVIILEQLKNPLDASIIVYDLVMRVNQMLFEKSVSRYS